MNKLLIVLDGAAGSKKERQTAFSLAEKPNIDFLAKHSKTGFLRIARKLAPTSETGIISVLGANPFRFKQGRGVFEALGLGVRYKNGWLALRANFATVKGRTLIDRRVARSLTTKEAKLLEKEINHKVKLPVKFVFKASQGHRGILVLKQKLSKNISNTDPAYSSKEGVTYSLKNFKKTIRLCKPLDNSKLSRETSRIINLFTLQAMNVLSRSKVNKKLRGQKRLQANAILLRAPENKIPTFPKYKKWVAIADFPLEKGIAKIFGMKIIPLKPTKNRKSELIQKAKLARKFLKTKNVFVHIKFTDVYGHDGNLKEKAKAISDIDKHFFSNLKPIFKKTKIALTSDHATPCSLKAHSNDPVPFLIYPHKSQTNFFSEKTIEGKTISAQRFFKLLNS
jgi:2,3-bisphosphoglycerate-independent phosphoglycerate mutase